MRILRESFDGVKLIPKTTSTILVSIIATLQCYKMFHRAPSAQMDNNERQKAPRAGLPWNETCSIHLWSACEQRTPVDWELNAPWIATSRFLQRVSFM